MAQARERRSGAAELEKSLHEDLSNPARLLLVDFRDRPYVPVALRYEELRISVRLGRACTTELIQQELVWEVEVHTCRPGRPEKFYELTPKGTDLVGSQKLGPGKGGLAHRHYQRRNCDRHVGLGYLSKVEAILDGKIG